MQGGPGPAVVEGLEDVVGDERDRHGGFAVIAEGLHAQGEVELVARAFGEFGQGLALVGVGALHGVELFADRAVMAFQGVGAVRDGGECLGGAGQGGAAHADLYLAHGVVQHGAGQVHDELLVEKPVEDRHGCLVVRPGVQRLGGAGGAVHRLALGVECDRGGFGAGLGGGGRRFGGMAHGLHRVSRDCGGFFVERGGGEAVAVLHELCPCGVPPGDLFGMGAGVGDACLGSGGVGGAAGCDDGTEFCLRGAEGVGCLGVVGRRGQRGLVGLPPGSLRQGGVGVSGDQRLCRL